MSLSEITKHKLKLAKERRPVPSSLQDHLKETRRIHKAILDVAAEPISVPDMAEKTGIPTAVVFWHVNALRKYDKLVDVKKSGEYWLYQRK
jgi:hypothetical protein